MASNSVLQLLLQFGVDDSSAQNALARVQRFAKTLEQNVQITGDPNIDRAIDSGRVKTIRERIALEREALELRHRYGVTFQTDLQAGAADLKLQREKIALLTEQAKLNIQKVSPGITGEEQRSIQATQAAIAIELERVKLQQQQIKLNEQYGIQSSINLDGSIEALKLESQRLNLLEQMAKLEQARGLPNAAQVKEAELKAAQETNKAEMLRLRIQMEAVELEQKYGQQVQVNLKGSVAELEIERQRIQIIAQRAKLDAATAPPTQQKIIEQNLTAQMAEVELARQKAQLELEILTLQKRYGIQFNEQIGQTMQEVQLQRQKAALLKEQNQLQTRQTSPDIINRPPTFIQFSVFPLAQLFRSLGANDVSNRLMDAGAVLGLVDSLAILEQQLGRLAANIRESQGFIGTLARTVQTVAPAFGTLTAAIVGIGVIALPVIGAFAAISAVLAENQRQAEESKKRIEEFTETIGALAEKMAGGTGSAGFRDSAVEEERRALAFQATADSLRETFDYLDQLGTGQMELPEGVDISNFDQFVQGELQKVADNFGIPLASVQELVTVISNLDAKAKEATASATAYTAAANAPLARINELYGKLTGDLPDRLQGGLDAVAEFLDEARETAEKAVGLENAFIMGGLEGLDAIETQTSAQISDMREQAERDLDRVIQKMSLVSGKEAERYDLERQRLVGLISVLNQAPALTVADFENAKKEVEEYRTQIAELTADFQRQARQLAEERAISARREAEDFGRSRERTLEAEERAMAREDRDRARRQEREQKEAARRFEDFLKRIRQIIEDFALRMSEAVAERDALAFVRAKRERDKQLKEEDENYKEAEKRREEDLKDEQDYFEESRRERIEDFQRRLREEDDDRALRLRRQVEDYQRRDLIEQDNFNRRRQQLFNQLSFEAQIYQATANQATFYINYITSSFISGLQAMAQYTATAFTGGGTTTPDHGSPWAGWGAMTARGSGSMTINVAGAQQRTIEATSRQVALSTFDRVLTDMGL